MAYENYTINQFKKAWFKEDYSEMSKEQFDIVYTEYVDTAQLFLTEEFEKVSYIHYINNRINSIKMAIRLQREFLNEFDIPYIKGFDFFKKFGHIIFWNNEKEKFLNALKIVETKEKKYISKLENEIKSLKENRLKKRKGEVTIKQKQQDFIRLIISLGKLNYKIDNDKTTVEELALMILQQKEENEAIKSNK